MSETPQLTVPTAFNDISQLAEGMSDRVDEERLMLYGPGPVDDNSWIRFSVLLMDQSVALSGVGRAVASIDGGDERPEVARFDIVLDNLQFEGTSEVVYERMLVYRSQAFAEGPGTGEVSTEDVEAAEAALVGDEVEDLAQDSTMVAAADEYAEQIQATADEAPADDQEMGLADFAENEDEAATVVADSPSEGYEDVGESYAEAAAVSMDGPDEAYEDAAPTAVYADDQAGDYSAADEVSADEVSDDLGGYDAPHTDAESFADVHTEDIAEPAEWGTDEVDVSAIDEVVEGDVPPSAPPPAPPQAPPGFTIEATNGALTRASRGATWEPNLALAPDPRAPSGLFPYPAGLPVPQNAPRPDLDPSYYIQPAPRPVEASGDQTDMESDGRRDTGGHDEVEYDDADVVAEDSFEAEAAPEFEASADDEGDPELEPVDASELSYEDDYAVEDDAASFDDASTEVVSDHDVSSDGYDEVDPTRMDLEAPEEQ